jgi:uncharacterized lipoprotein YmbA
MVASGHRKKEALAQHRPATRMWANGPFRLNGFAGILVVLLSGCAQPTPPRYYAISALAPSTNATAPVAIQDPARFSWAVDRVLLPTALDRNSLLRRVDEGGEIRVDVIHLWSEPLPEAIRRITALNLSRLWGTTAVYQDARMAPRSQTGHIGLDIQSLEFIGWAKVRMEVLWTLHHPDGRTWAGRFEGVETTHEPVPHEEVQALNRLLLRLAQTVAASGSAMSSQ